MPASPKKTSPEPPAAAVAADAHWSATREKLRNRVRPTVPLTICDDVVVKKAVEEARWTVRRLKAEADENPTDPAVTGALRKAEAELARAQEAFDAIAIRLEFQALRRPDFEELKRRHPPTEEQAEDNLSVNVESLGPELIAAASLDGITVDDAKFYLEEWGEGEAAALFNAAWGVQANVRLDMGKG